VQIADGDEEIGVFGIAGAIGGADRDAPLLQRVGLVENAGFVRSEGYGDLGRGRQAGIGRNIVTFTSNGRCPAKISA
jgi:hypothetical protein